MQGHGEVVNAVYLLVLLFALGGVLLAALRRGAARTIQQLSIWALIFLGFIAAYGMQDRFREWIVPAQKVLPGDKIALPRSPDGHYYVTAEVNGVPVRFVVDTGASQIVLSRQDARRIGLPTAGLAYTGSASTANGTVATAPVRLERIDIGPIHDRNIHAVVNDGAMEGSLLGMSYLTRFARVTFDRDQMILER